VWGARIAFSDRRVVVPDGETSRHGNATTRRSKVVSGFFVEARVLARRRACGDRTIRNCPWPPTKGTLALARDLPRRALQLARCSIKCDAVRKGRIPHWRRVFLNSPSGSPGRRRRVPIGRALSSGDDHPRRRITLTNNGLRREANFSSENVFLVSAGRDARRTGGGGRPPAYAAFFTLKKTSHCFSAGRGKRREHALGNVNTAQPIRITFVFAS